MIDTGCEDLVLERDGALAWITFRRPHAHNAMTFAMYEALQRACDLVEEDEGVRAVVLRGAGEKAFVSGTDIGEFQGFTGAPQAIAYEARLDAVFDRLAALARPTIALVRGFCLGGGACLAIACDLRVCTPDARFGVPIARTLGNCLSIANTARLIDLIGPARTKELLFTARLVGAEEAKAAGLVSEIALPEAIDARVRELAGQIAGNAPLTVQVTKEAVRRVLAHRRPPPGEDLVARAYGSEDFREGVRAFLEKRPAKWKGR